MHRVLHDGIIDGLRRTGQEGDISEADEIHVAVGVENSVTAETQHRRLQSLHLLEKGLGREQEHAAVPVIFAGGEVTFCRGAIWFFHKTLDGKHAGRLGERTRAFDIAIPSFGRCWFDAEGHQRAAARCPGSLCNRLMESLDVCDYVIGRHQQHQALRIVFQNLEGGNGSSRRGVAPGRLQNDARIVHARGTQLLRDQEPGPLLALKSR